MDKNVLIILCVYLTQADQNSEFDNSFLYEQSCLKVHGVLDIG